MRALSSLAKTLFIKSVPKYSIFGCGCCELSRAVCCGLATPITLAKAICGARQGSAALRPRGLCLRPRVSQRADHLARLRLADLFLDTLPYNAHTTACDALWAGLPLLTCRGNTFPARVAASLLHAIGLPELVTTSLDEYEAMARVLSQKPERLAAIKSKLLRNRDIEPLFDPVGFTRRSRVRLHLHVGAASGRFAAGRFRRFTLAAFEGNNSRRKRLLPRPL